MSDILAHGGRFQGPDRFLAPWTAAIPYDSIDAYEHMVVRDSNVAVLARPDSASALVARVGYAIVASTVLEEDYDWHVVPLVGGGLGYLRTRHLGSPNAFRIYFERTDGRWRILYFLAGD